MKITDGQKSDNLKPSLQTTRAKFLAYTAAGTGLLSLVTATVAFAVPAAWTACIAVAIVLGVSAVAIAAIAISLYKSVKHQPIVEPLDSLRDHLSPAGQRLYDDWEQTTGEPLEISPLRLVGYPGLLQVDLLLLMDHFAGRVKQLLSTQTCDNNKINRLFDNLPTLDGARFDNLQYVSLFIDQVLPFRNLHLCKQLKNLSLRSRGFGSLEAAEIKAELLTINHLDILKLDAGVCKSLSLSKEDLFTIFDNHAGNSTFKIHFYSADDNPDFVTRLLDLEEDTDGCYRQTFTVGGTDYLYELDNNGDLCRRLAQHTGKPSTPSLNMSLSLEKQLSESGQSLYMFRRADYYDSQTRALRPGVRYLWLFADVIRNWTELTENDIFLLIQLFGPDLGYIDLDPGERKEPYLADILRTIDHFDGTGCTKMTQLSLKNCEGMKWIRNLDKCAKLEVLILSGTKNLDAQSAKTEIFKLKSLHSICLQGSSLIDPANPDHLTAGEIRQLFTQNPRMHVAICGDRETARALLGLDSDVYETEAIEEEIADESGQTRTVAYLLRCDENGYILREMIARDNQPKVE